MAQSRNNPDSARRWTALLCAPLLLMLAGTPTAADVVDRIIATVNDEAITLSDYYVALPIFIQLNQVPPQAYATADGRRALATRLLEDMINRALLDEQAEEHELAIEPGAVDSYITMMSQQMGATVEQLRSQLEQEGIDFDDFHEFIRLELTKLRVVNVLVTSGITVSDAEVDAVMAERYPDSASTQHYDISQILLVPARDATPEEREAVRQELDSIRVRILEGESFEALAREHSQDASRRRDGNMGEFERGQLPEEFERHALNLVPGDVSEVFETRFGFHIVRLNRTWDESAVDVDSVREQIYREIQQDKQRREIERFMAGLHEESIIVIQFDPAELY